jgi:hypothetical protein
VPVADHRRDAHHPYDDLIALKLRNVCVELCNGPLELGLGYSVIWICVALLDLPRHEAQILAPHVHG